MQENHLINCEKRGYYIFFEHHRYDDYDLYQYENKAF